MPSIDKRPMGEFPLLDPTDGIPLFYPSMSNLAEAAVGATLKTRWIGQGPKVESFEQAFGSFIGAEGRCIAVNSGTSALHLAYVLAGVGPGKKVVAPLFTCTATNLPILYLGGIPVFCDVRKNSLNMNLEDVERLIDKETVAISVVDYGGLPNDYLMLRDICDRHNLYLIADLAHAVDGFCEDMAIHEYVDFACYSFQAIKTLTCGDGGCLVVRDLDFLEKARRLRWFGIDRTSKQKGIWENDVREIGYKFQMNDVAASIGLANLAELKNFLTIRNKIFKAYLKGLGSTLTAFVVEASASPRVTFTPWLLTLLCQGKKNQLMEYLRSKKVESAQVHYRNDRYSVFASYVEDRVFENMNALDNEYLVLPLHTRMTPEDGLRIGTLVREFFERH